ncbi:hypothetical protein BDW22DRAFT_1348821 [Trametopsis cervina]|nr:hypothetical protein BDW22DRAFT_1348821 [Trametopsis cervina]
MPVPAVYIAAAVGTVVAVIAFKEFVYDPHIAPKVNAWHEAHQPRRVPVRVAAKARSSDNESSDDDDDDADDHANGISVEMQNLVARETSEWQEYRTNSTLRHRTNKSRSVLDEASTEHISNVFVPFDPISPTASSSTSSFLSSPAISEAPTLPATPVIHSPTPLVPVSANTLQSAVRSQSASPELHTAPTSPTLEAGLASPTVTASSSNSSFTPAVVGPRSASSRSGSVISETGRSTTYDVVSPPRSVASPPTPMRSPFSDIQHPLSPVFARSPSPHEIRSPGVDSFINLPSESDFAILSPSLRSGMFSPSIDDPFEIASEIGSDDLSAWESVGHRTPSP